MSCDDCVNYSAESLSERDLLDNEIDRTQRTLNWLVELRRTRQLLDDANGRIRTLEAKVKTRRIVRR